MRAVTRIVIHNSATQDSGTVSWNAIRKYHMTVKGFESIGYHAGAELVGDRYEVLMGRPLRRRGAHAIGANHDSIGLCLIGDFSVKPPPREQLIVAAEFCADMCAVFDISTASIHGHSDVSEGRTCPGAAFPWEGFIALVRERFKGQ